MSGGVCIMKRRCSAVELLFESPNTFWCSKTWTLDIVTRILPEIFVANRNVFRLV